MIKEIKYRKGDIIANPWTSSTYNGKPNYHKYFVFTSRKRNTISGFCLNASRTNFENITFKIDDKPFLVVGHTKILDEFKNELDTIINKDVEAEK